MTTPLADTKAARVYLNRVARAITRDLKAGDKLDGKLVELDIAKCRLHANVGLAWAKKRPRIQLACQMLGIDEDRWCREVLGRAIVTLQGYRQVGREWKRYVVQRRALGECGATGIDLARSLVPMNAHATNSSNPRVRLTKLDISRCEFITDDALSAFRKMPDESVDVIPTSPPYFPLRRTYGGSFDGLSVGWESTVQEYIGHLVAIFREAKRVLRKRGMVIIVMKDAYSTAQETRDRPHTHKLRRPNKQKEWMPDGMPIQRGDRPTGNLLLIPLRFALKMQDEGWYLRMYLPIRINGHPESVEDRTTLDYEWMMVFTKQRKYHWNQDAIREPLAASARPRKRRWTKDGVIRRDKVRDVRLVPNPLGRNSSSVLCFNAANYRGTHPATMPEDMAEWILSAACDDNALVCDPFGGVGTFALASLRLGHRAKTIDIFDKYTKEARERLTNAPAEPRLKKQVDQDARDQQERIRELEAERDDLRLELERLTGRRVVEVETAWVSGKIPHLQSAVTSAAKRAG